MATWGTLTWNTGNWGEQDNSDAFPSGIGASFSLGTVTTVSTVEFGWGRDTYGARAWGSPNQIVNPSGIEMTASAGSIDPAPDAMLTGIALTAALGNETAFTDLDISLTGFTLTNVLGNESAFTSVNVIPTGIAMTNSLGDETTAGEINTGWGRLTWNENAWGIAGDLRVTGIAATAALGNESISIDVSPIPTGIAMTASQGDESTEISFKAEPTGIAATANLGTADAGPDAMLTGIGGTASVGSVDAYNLEGWGRYFYGQFEWGATGEWDIVPVTGIAMSANLGNETITGHANLTLTGIAMTAAEGDIDPSPDATVTGIGFQAAIGVGTVTAGADVDTVTGIAMTANLGTAILDANTISSPTGIAITATLSEESVVGDATAQLTGIGLTMSINSVNALIWNEVNTGSAPIDPPGWVEVPTRAA